MMRKQTTIINELAIEYRMTRKINIASYQDPSLLI